MDYLINLMLGVLGSLIAAEVIFHHKRWCRRIVHLAGARIEDSAQSAIKLEEWLAALDEHEGVLASFWHAIGCWAGAPAVAAALKQPAAKEASSTTRRRGPPQDAAKTVIERAGEKAARISLEILKRTLRESVRALEEGIRNPPERNISNHSAENFVWSTLQNVFLGVAASGAAIIQWLQRFFR